MKNAIQQAVDQSRGGPQERLHGSTATQQYRAATVQADVRDNSWAEGMAKFAKGATDAYGVYEKSQEKLAEERSDEIIRKLSPEQRREARANGTLLYQDDKQVMEMLNFKTGRNAAFEVDSEMKNDLQRYRTREEFEEARQVRMQQKSQSYAEAAGVDMDDVNYQKGFNNQIVQRNAALYDSHAQFLSKQLSAQASLEARNDISPMMDDVTIMKDPSAGRMFVSYLNKGIESGEIPTDSEAIDTLTMLAKDAINKEHGLNLLDTMGEQELNVLGGKRKIKDIFGPEVYENLKVSAQEAAYKRNAGRTRDFQLGITQAENQDNPAEGWAMIQKLRDKNQWLQDSDEMTPQKQALIAAEQRILTRTKQETAAKQSGIVKATQADNRIDQLRRQYESRIAGENVNVQPKFQPVDDSTGEFKESDAMTMANRVLEDIKGSGLPEAKQDEMRAQYLRADYENGPFQEAFKTNITDAEREWQQALVSGQAGEFPRLNELARAYEADPSTISQLYPEKAGFIVEMNQMLKSGIDPQIMVEAAKNRRALSKDEQRFADEQWSSIKNDSSAPELAALPRNLEQTARSLFDAFNLRTGDANAAAAETQKWLQENTVQFADEGGWRDSTARVGMLNKKDLMIDPNNIQSWEQGKAIVDKTLKGLKEMPYWSGSKVTVEVSEGGDILMKSLNGKMIRMTKDQMRMIQAAEQRAAEEMHMDQGVQKAQKQQELHERYILGGGRKQ